MAKQYAGKRFIGIQVSDGLHKELKRRARANELNLSATIRLMLMRDIENSDALQAFLESNAERHAERRAEAR